MIISAVINKHQTGNWFVSKRQAPDGTTWATRRTDIHTILENDIGTDCADEKHKISKEIIDESEMSDL